MLSAPCYNKDNYRMFIFKIYVQKSIELLFFFTRNGCFIREEAIFAKGCLAR